MKAELSWREALAKFVSAADWTKEDFESACANDPFWAAVKKAYSEPPRGAIMAKDNALLRLLRKKRP